MPDISEVIFEVKNKKAITDIEKMKKSLDSTSKSAEGLVSILLQSWSASKIMQSVKSVAQKFEDVKVTAAAFRKIFKDSMDTANIGVQDLIQNFNETERSAQKLLNTIGGRLSNLGLDSNELATFASQLARVTQELTAAGLGASLEENAKKLAQGLLGEVGGLKDLGIFIDTVSDSFNEQVKAAQENLKVSEQLARAHVVYGEILKQTSQYSGTFAQKAGDLNQALGDIQNTLDSGLFAKIGQNLSAVLTPILQIINSFLSSQIVQKFGGLLGTIAAITIPLALIKGAFGWIGKILWDKIKTGSEITLRSFKDIGSQAAIIFKRMIQNTDSLAEKTLKISKAWEQARDEARRAQKQFIQSERNKVFGGTWTGKKTANAAFDKWITNEWKLGSDEMKTINAKAKLVSTALLDRLAYMMIGSSNELVHTIGITFNHYIQTTLIPMISNAFGNSKVLSGAFVGISELLKNIVLNFKSGRADFKAASSTWAAAIFGFSKTVLTQIKLILTTLATSLKTFSFNIKYVTSQIIANLGLTNATKKVGAKLQSGFAAMFVSIGVFFKGAITKLGAGIAAAIGAFSKTVLGVAAGIFSMTGAIAGAIGFTLAAAVDTVFNDGAYTRVLAEKLYNWWENIISWFTGEATTAEMKAAAQKQRAAAEANAAKRREEFHKLEKQQADWMNQLKAGLYEDTITEQMAEVARNQIAHYTKALETWKGSIKYQYEQFQKALDNTHDVYGSKAEKMQQELQASIAEFKTTQNKLNEYKQMLEKYNNQQKALEEKKNSLERQRLQTIRKSLEANDKMLEQNLKYLNLNKQLKYRVADLTSDPTSQEKIKRFTDSLETLRDELNRFYFLRYDSEGNVEKGWKLTASKFEEMKNNEANLIIDIAKTRIDALRNQQSALSKFKDFVAGIWAKITEFKNRGADAIIAGTSADQNFVNSYSKEAGLGAYFENSKRQSELIQKQILKIQTDTEQNVQKIYKELLKTKGAQNAVYISAVTAV